MNKRMCADRDRQTPPPGQPVKSWTDGHGGSNEADGEKIRTNELTQPLAEDGDISRLGPTVKRRGWTMSPLIKLLCLSSSIRSFKGVNARGRCGHKNSCILIIFATLR